MEREQELNNFYNYLVENKIGFNPPYKYSYAFEGYNIKCYRYKLYIEGFLGNIPQISKQFANNKLSNPIDCKNCFIKCIPEPTNKIEKKLYSYIVNHLSSYLPIKIECKYCLYDDDYKLESQDNVHGLRIGINSFDDVYLIVYYLEY